MALRSLYVITSLVFLASCSSKNSDTTAAPQTDDAVKVTLDDFDPKKAPKLSGAELLEAVSELKAPVVPNFNNSQMSLVGNRHRTFLTAFTGAQITDTYGDCVDNTKPTVDKVTADGSSATYDYRLDVTQCLNDEIVRAGGAVSNSSCMVVGQMMVTCPGKDFTSSNGKTIAEAQSNLGMGVSDCKLASGATGTVKVQVVGNCSLIGTVDGKTYSFDSKFRNGFMNSSGADCEFTNNGGQIVLGDCFDASAQLDNNTNPSGGNSTTHIISRYGLKAAKFNLQSVTYSSGQNLGLDVNDWTGTLAPDSNGAIYKLTNGTDKKSGRIFP